jgi:Leucine-rich repeat (LRR) protein
LVKNDFPVLEILDIEENQIGNNAIEILSKANLPKLKYLNLFRNKLTSIKIFDVVKNFKELEAFFIGGNKFDMEEINRDKLIFIFPESVEEFGITGNFDGNADFVKRLNIENLKIFYISRNQIPDLKCLKNIKFKRLDEFWAISNKITDIREIMNIQGKENIWKINLKQNKISHFQELFGIVNNFPNLKELGLVDNGITQEEAEDMAKRIKIEYDMDLYIKVKED